MPYVTINGIRLHYELRGDPKAPPVLLHPGLGGTQLSWSPVASRLELSHRLILFDPRDVGESGRATKPYAIADLASDVVGLLDHLALASVDVVGLSMGGAVAQELAITYPARVRRLVLLATYDSGDPRGTFVFRHLAHLRRTLPREDFTRLLLPWLYTHEELSAPGVNPEAIVARMLEEPNIQESEAYERQMEATIAFHSRDRLDRIRCPTLLVFGDDDLFTPMRFARSLSQRIRGSRLEVLSGAGHALAWTRSKEVASLIHSFLSEQMGKEPAPRKKR
ncbi:MAG: alpha/beta fold hydrolase [Chloroflexi bacterium]|nr:alpha/beta fold hydrolase [Chloroflexota bacterium]